MWHMSRKRLMLKKDTLNIRISPRIKRLIEQVAYSEGLAASEWVRILIINELRRRGVLRKIQVPPGLEEGE